MANPSLNDKDIRKITGLIRSWNTKLTWDLLVQRIELEFAVKTTRQTLSSYSSIKTEFQSQKQSLRLEQLTFSPNYSKQDVDLIKEVESLKNKIERLQAEKDTESRRVDQQLAFIREITEVAKNHPNVMNVLEDVKRRILNRQSN
ncbi:MAG: hypothetical protein HWE16_11405 [Gammaproteobacteria bacterium]|nr:hypothetical protein [Gammaproteobacteria bacterium]